MSASTSIEWTSNPDGTPGKTWNPIRGCSVISPGCVHCYAMKQAHRFSGADKPYAGLTKLTSTGPQWTGKIRTVDAALLEPLSWRKPTRVFVNSMSDLFHDGVEESFVDQVFATMALAPRHTFQVLTKRADRMLAYLTKPGKAADIAVAVFKRFTTLRESDVNARRALKVWPLPNVWPGASVENQPMYDQRIGALLRTPAAVRFLSVEPMLGAIDMRMGGMSVPEFSPRDPLPEIDWVIVGGESGPGARPFDLAWARSIVQQCKSAGVPVFVKQLGACAESIADRITFKGSRTPKPDGFYRHLNDRKGGDMAEWPEDLRVREFPQSHGDSV